MDQATRNGFQKLEELEEEVRRAVEELKTLRGQREAAQAEAEKLRAALKERGETLRRLEAQLVEFQTEREQVRSRIEQLVAQIDSLTGDQPSKNCASRFTARATLSAARWTPPTSRNSRAQSMPPCGPSPPRPIRSTRAAPPGVGGS